MLALPSLARTPNAMLPLCDPVTVGRADPAGSTATDGIALGTALWIDGAAEVAGEVWAACAGAEPWLPAAADGLTGAPQPPSTRTAMARVPPSVAGIDRTIRPRPWLTAGPGATPGRGPPDPTPLP